MHKTSAAPARRFAEGLADAAKGAAPSFYKFAQGPTRIGYLGAYILGHPEAEQPLAAAKVAAAAIGRTYGQASTAMGTALGDAGYAIRGALRACASGHRKACSDTLLAAYDMLSQIEHMSKMSAYSQLRDLLSEFHAVTTGSPAMVRRDELRWPEVFQALAESLAADAPAPGQATPEAPPSRLAAILAGRPETQAF